MAGGLVGDPGAEIGVDPTPRAARGRARSRRRSPIRASRVPRRSAAAAPRGRRSDARPQGGGRARRGICGPRFMCSSFGCITARSRCAARSSRPGRSGRSARGCRRPGARPRGAGHTCTAPVQGSSDPGWCIPVSNSTTPSPAATAQALQWGTLPGQGSGKHHEAPGRIPFEPAQLGLGLPRPNRARD